MYRRHFFGTAHKKKKYLLPSAFARDKVEEILQDTLFQPRPLLEETVTKTMEKVLEIRDDILARTKAIRTGEGEITICPEQNIKQEEFLTQIRMSVRASM